MSNPLLSQVNQPAFSDLELKHLEPAIDEILRSNRALIKEVLAQGDFSWEGLVYPLEQAEDTLNNVWSVISHYNGVLNSDELREIYKSLIVKLTEYSTEVGQNKDLYEAYLAVSKSPRFEGFLF